MQGYVSNSRLEIRNPFIGLDCNCAWPQREKHELFNNRYGVVFNDHIVESEICIVVFRGEIHDLKQKNLIYYNMWYYGSKALS